MSPYQDGIHTGTSHHLRPFLIAVARSVFAIFFCILGISGRETLFADFCRNARPGTGSSTTLGPGPSVRSNFLAAWIVGLGHGELASWARAWGASLRARRVALFGLYWVFLCFSEIRQKRLKPLNIRNACGERLEKRSLHPPPVPARDLPLGVGA